MFMLGEIDVTSIFTSMGTQAEAGVTAVLPVAGAILAAIIGLKLGIKIFKNIAGRA